MKDKIFLIWSGSNIIAKKIKRILEDDYNYICYVGGNYENDSQMVSIGDTVIRQMRSCNQAIVMFQNKENEGLSNNLFFELGYVSAKYGMKKVHCVKRIHDNIVLPTDFDNSFVEGLEASSDDAYAENIVTYFINRQKLSVDTNKMYLINNRYMIHEMIQVHHSDVGSKCSDYELAQYILFYMQAAIMFQDDDIVLEELREFKKRHNSKFSTELTIAINLSISMLEVQTKLIASDDIIYITDDSFRKYFNMCKEIVDEIKTDDSGTFDEWAKVFASENLAYACTLYATNPNITSDMRTYLHQKTIEYGMKCIDFISVLEANTPCYQNNDNVGLMSLFRAYIYRHLFTATKALASDDAGKWLTQSLKERKGLLRYFDKNSIDSKLYANFEMEYYLNLIEYIEYFGRESIDEFEYMMYLNDIDSFIEGMPTEINAYLQKITNQRKSIK